MMCTTRVQTLEESDRINQLHARNLDRHLNELKENMSIMIKEGQDIIQEANELSIETK